jgi:tRNA-(ms[2]io[6]A)-hydroxylase
VAERRRLPVLQDKPPSGSGGEGEDEQRPPLHWVGFGVVAIFAAWLPLTYLAGSISARLLRARFGAAPPAEAVLSMLRGMDAGEQVRLLAIVALPGLAALAVAAFGGGFVVGRFGSGTGAREAAWAGAVTALLASAMAWSSATASSIVAAATTLAVAAVFSGWGGRFGARRARRAAPAKT